MSRKPTKGASTAPSTTSTAPTTSSLETAPERDAAPLQRTACGCDCGGTCKDGGDEQKESGSPVQRRSAESSSGPTVQRGFNPLGAVADLAKKAANAAMGAIKGLASQAMGAATSLGSSILGKAASLASSAKAAVGSAGAAAVAKAVAAGTAVASAVKAGAAKVTSSVKGLAAKITGTVTAAGQQILAKAKSMGSAAIAGAQRLGSQAVAAGRAAGAKALGWAKSKGASVLAKAKSVGGKVFAFADKASGGLLGKAVAIGRGALTAVKAKAGALRQQAVALGKRAWETVKANPCKALAMLTPFGLVANSAIGDGVKALGTKAGALAKTGIGKVGAAGKSLWALVTNKNGQGSSLVKGVVGKAKAAAGALKTKLLGGAKTFGTKVVNGAKAAGTKAWTTAKSLASAGWNKAKGLATGMLGKAKSFGTAAIAAAKERGQALLSGAKAIGTAVLGKAKEIGTRVVGTLDGLTGGMASKVQGIASKILGRAAGLLSFVVSFAQKAASAAINKAKGLATSAISRAKAAGTWVLDKAKAAGQQVLARAKSVGTAVFGLAKNVAAAALSTARSVGAKVVAGIKRVGTAAFNAAKSMATKAFGAAKSFATKALGAARSFGAKAWSGITSFGAKAWSAVKSLGGKALAAAKRGAAKAMAKAKSVLGPTLWGVVTAAGRGAKNLVSKALSGAKAVGKKAAGAVGCFLKGMGIDPKKLDLILDFIPGVSNVKDAISAITGINPITGEVLSPAERLLAAAFAIPGYGNAAKVVGKGGKLALKGIKAMSAPLLRLGAKVGPFAVQAGEWTARKAAQLTEALTKRIQGGTDVAGDGLSAAKHADDIPSVKPPKAMHDATPPKGSPRPGSTGPGKGKGSGGGATTSKQPVKVGGPKDTAGGAGRTPGAKGPGGTKGPDADDVKPKGPEPAPGGPATAKELKAQIDELVERARNDPLYREEMRAASQGQPGVPKGAIQWGPGTGPGPIGVTDGGTFRSSTYIEEVTTEPIRLYRYSDSKKAREFGPFWSMEPPSGPLSNQLDNAVLPEWNDFEKLTVIEVPAGTTIFRGPAAGQVSNTHRLPGGGEQVFIPRDIDKKPWAVHSGPAKQTDDVVAAAQALPKKTVLGDGSIITKDEAGKLCISRCPAPDADQVKEALERSTQMLGANGVQTPSKTLWNRGPLRVDVENPNPGQRPGQVHLQDLRDRRTKHLYDPETDQFVDMKTRQPSPKAVQKMLTDPEVRRAVDKAMRFLNGS